jgi:single-strand DNA-binding protein
MINKVLLIGNLGKDPEIKHFDNGGAVGKFSLATNENYLDKAGEWQTNTEWHDVVVWNRSATRAEKQLKKGMMVYVEGKLTHRKWQDDQGNNRYNTEVVAAVFRVLEKRERTDGGFNNLPGQDAAPPISNNNTSNTNTPSSAAEPTEKMEDDLPF